MINEQVTLLLICRSINHQWINWLWHEIQSFQTTLLKYQNLIEPLSSGFFFSEINLVMCANNVLLYQICRWIKVAKCAAWLKFLLKLKIELFNEISDRSIYIFYIYIFYVMEAEVFFEFQPISLISYLRLFAGIAVGFEIGQIQWTLNLYSVSGNIFGH